MTAARPTRLPFAAALALSLGLIGAPALALSPGDANIVAQADAYLDQVATLKAHFLQVAQDGSTAEGTLYLSRPGRMRLDYDPPTPILVVASGGTLVYYDAKLGQVSYVDLDSTLAGVLVQPQVHLDQGALKVESVVRQPGVVYITVDKRDDPRSGRITLVFSESPLQLRQWKVVDAQGQTTTVSLYDAETGIRLADDLFEFHDPRSQPPAAHH